MVMRKWVGFAAGVLLACGATGQAQAAQPSAQQVRQLFEVMHLSQAFGQMAAQIGTSLSRQMSTVLPCVPASYWQNFLDTDSTEQIMARMVPVYQNHFTAEDVAGLLRFYQSPLGQKVIAQMPVTMAEGMRTGQEWGRERGMQMMSELQLKGTLNAQGRCPAVGTPPPPPVPKH